MTTKNAGATAAKAAYTNSHEFANEKVDPSCTKCAETPPIRAIILYPNIGTPLVIPPKEKYLTLFIAAEDSSKTHFGVRNNSSGKFPIPAISGYRYVDKHLRFYSIDNKKTKEDTEEGRLWNDGKLCGKAYENVKVWCLGPLNESITDIDGNIFANIRKRTLEQYAQIKSAHPDANDINSNNTPLMWVYQIKIKLESIPDLPTGGKIASLAWMVKMPENYKKQNGLSGMTDWEYQDKLIYDFLESQKKNTRKSHFPELYEFALDASSVGSTFPKQTKKLSHRLKAWHPFMVGTKDKLSIGHLSDVHINCRQFAMAKSEAQILKDISPKLGSKVDITFASLKNLFDEMKKEGADVLFITGDLLDFNRNLDPNEVNETITDQWTKFNVSKNVDNPKLYKRGLDDMLMYSLLRYSYQTLKLPVFVTTGNHEAYDIPYGISPRRNKKTDFTGFLEMNGTITPPGSMEPDTLGKQSILTTVSEFLPEPGYLGKNAARKVHGALDGNAYTHAKANEGVAADHNLTIYEACLMYGPTYAQALTSQNFTADNYDWFYTLFTPLADYVIRYDLQTLIGLDWGPDENYINLSGLIPLTSDHQGAGILPRASESINENQKKLLKNAFHLKKPKTTTLLFSHFTFINFSLAIPFRNGETQNFVKHSVGTFSQYNVGTCEKNQTWLYEACINNHVQYHFSGHSHRSGVYTVDRPKLNADATLYTPGYDTIMVAPNGPDVRTVNGFDPGIEPNHEDNRISDSTKLIVSSSGGPIGVQNHNNELFGFNMQFPSGTLLNQGSKRPIKLVKTDATKVPFSQPRLCVALDYLWVIWEMTDQKQAEEPIRFANPKEFSRESPADKMADFFAIRFGEKINRLNCVQEINFYLHVSRGGFNGWVKIKMRLDTKVTEMMRSKNFTHSLHFEEPEKFTLVNSMLNKVSRVKKPAVFCEVTLKKPTGLAVQHFNWEDKWYFPIIIGKSNGGHWFFTRARGVRGEMPDWDWLTSQYPNIYPTVKSVTKG